MTRVLTADEAHDLATRPITITRIPGKIWGGVQVVDSFMREIAEDILLGVLYGGYDGIYKNAADIEVGEMDLLTLDEEML